MTVTIYLIYSICYNAIMPLEAIYKVLLKHFMHWIDFYSSNTCVNERQVDHVESINLILA